MDGAGKTGLSSVPYNKWPIALVGAKGAMVTDTDGRTYLDLYGGHCVAFLGHNHPKVVAAH